MWYQNRLPWLDRDNNLLIVARAAPSASTDVVYNINLVRKGEVTSYYDLLQPKWKEKLNLQDPTTAGKGGSWFHASLEVYGLNIEFMKALAMQKPFLTRDKRQQLEWVSHGKHYVGLAVDDTTTEEFIKLGAPIDITMMKETKPRIGSGSSTIGLVKNAPQPNAAKVFANWYLSKEGQTVFGKSYAGQSARLDVPTEHLNPAELRNPNLSYFLEDEDFLLKRPMMQQLAREVFADLVQ